MSRTVSSPQTQLDRARQLLKRGHRPEALKLLLQLVEQDEHDEQAWWLLLDLVPDVQDQIIALENILTLNPYSGAAQKRLEQLRRSSGLWSWTVDQEALALLAPPGPEPASRPRRTAWPFMLTVVRLAAGPPALLIAFIVIHRGLNPLHLSPLDGVGVLVTLFGGLLVAMTDLKPLPARLEGIARVGVALAGWLLLLAPFVLLLWQAGERMAAYLKLPR